MTVSEAIRAAAERLGATSDTARLDAELLMAHAMGVSRSDVLLRHMSDEAPDGFYALVDRRTAHEPLAHIVGEQEFYGRPFRVSSDTLIPRGDSETLVDIALERSPDAKRILDLGTGTGALLLTVLAEGDATGIGTDRSPEALSVASDNAERLGLEQRARFELRDWRKPGWSDDLGQFDLILCNPPYIEDRAELDPDVRDHEPHGALFAGPEGLDDYRILIPQIRALMAPMATAIFEIGHLQAESVGAIAQENGFTISLRRDLAGRARALVLE